MELVRGIQPEALKLVVYGPEGIGKSTFAAQWPRPVFIDTEGSTTRMDVVRTPKPLSWTYVLEQVKYFIQHPGELETLVIDTADWAEKLCIEHVCAVKQMKSIEDAGYGRGYVFLAEEFGRFLNLLDELRGKGVHIVITAHAAMRKFEQPDESGAYDRWELKLQRKTAPLIKEWADAVLFCNYEVLVIKNEDKKAKAHGGSRVIYTSHHPCWDAKNRHDLPEKIKLDFSEIAHIIPLRGQAPAVSPASVPFPEAEPEPGPTFGETLDSPVPAAKAVQRAMDLFLPGVPKALADLMAANNVTIAEIQAVVAQKGYYPVDTPIANYDPGFIEGVLVGAWPQVFAMIQAARGGK